MRRGLPSGKVAPMKRLLLVAATLLAACAHVRAKPADARLDPLRAELDAADVVYFGEEHDDRAMHRYERDLLAAMDTGRPLLLGLEMFQRPFQAPLDDYVARRIDEKEMLRRTEYFDRWRFDYTLYAPLWRYCRDHGVRIVALNAEAALASKVGRQGLASLDGDERSRVAADVDLTDKKHRDRIVAMFESGAHKLPPEPLQKMYEAMTLWDETMAESAAAALAAAPPGARMLVVAGRGHVEDGTGVPDRVDRRRKGLRRLVVVGETAEKPDAPTVRADGAQRYVSFPDDEAPPAPKLGLGFEGRPERNGLLVKTVTPGGAAEKAGAKAGDVLARLDGAPVTDLVDVRWVVDPRRTGDVVAAKLVRDGAPIDVKVVLAPPPEHHPISPPTPDR
jgi:uncharacterized iron-regulated protein